MSRIERLVLRRISVCRVGFTLVEVLVAAGVFLLILGALVSTFYQSTAVMMKGTSQSSMQRDALAFGKRLSNAIEYGTAGSLSVAADESGMSLLISDDANGRFRYDPASSTALWSNYDVIYFDSVSHEVRSREVSVVGFSEEATPGPIESFDAGDPIETYFSGGQPVLRDVQSASFKEPLPGLVRVDIELARDDSRKDGAETYNFSLVRNFRN